MSVVSQQNSLPSEVEALPLRDGDRLDQPTFHERYEAMPTNVHAQLINGIVYMASPVALEHADLHASVIFWMSLYTAATPGTKVSDNATVILGETSEPQPDASLRMIDGKTKIVRRGKKTYIGGPPELVAEISSTTEQLDLGDKFHDYEQFGVEEYVVIRAAVSVITWFVRQDGRFVELPPDTDCVLKSRAFPGLWLDPVALVSGNLKRVQEVLNQGLVTPEHAAFVASVA